MGICLIHDLRASFDGCTLNTRRAFPSDPRQVIGRCGYWFETKDGRRIRVKEAKGRRVLVVE